MSKRDEHIRNMRWLYDNDKTYRKAAARLKLDELKAQREKTLIRQYRRRQRRIWLNKAKTILTPVRQKLTALTARSNRQKLIWTSAGAGLLLIIWAGWALLSHHAATGRGGTLGASTIKPDFQPILPQNGNPNFSTTENNNQKIVTYTDSFNNANLIVSQQKLPDSFKGDPNAITQLDQFKTAETLDTSKGKLFITTNNTGQQWAAITFGDVLIFFQSDRRIGFDDWYKYIKELTVH